jgi:Fe-S cluster assembly ATP-binding protein
MLEVKNLKVNVEQTPILRGVELSVPAGKTTVIMGPNGSGKSTLASTVAADPRYEITAGSIVFEDTDITSTDSSERSRNGIFLAHQNPLAIEGLICKTFLWQLQQLHHPDAIGIIDFKDWLRKKCVELQLDQELMQRALNDDFSGGEKKKLEIIQMQIIKPRLIILDEIDSGLDIDALKIVTKAVVDYQTETKAAILLITHYTKILDMIKPDTINVMRRGKIARSGGLELIADIEQNGY